MSEQSSEAPFDQYHVTRQIWTDSLQLLEAATRGDVVVHRWMWGDTLVEEQAITPDETFDPEPVTKALVDMYGDLGQGDITYAGALSVEDAQFEVIVISEKLALLPPAPPTATGQPQ